eukprot:GHVL01014567.1.p1 GENE.GHVL01014567.1~~GHVL01014567.1.p1  ORF type:complete len:214 (+),score=27.50 GHVL01014567.1:301-942(+)
MIIICIRTLTRPNKKDVNERIQVAAMMNLTQDAVHNFLDGVTVAGSFLSSPAQGIAASIAVLAHEIPQEIGDVVILTEAGYSCFWTTFFNILVSLTSFFGAHVVFAYGSSKHAIGSNGLYKSSVVCIATGALLYMALSEVLPEAFKIPTKKTKNAAVMRTIANVFFLSLGIAAMVLVHWVEHEFHLHSHDHPHIHSHSHPHDSHIHSHRHDEF